MTAFDYFALAHPQLAQRQARLYRVLAKIRQHHDCLSERIEVRFSARLYDRCFECLDCERRIVHTLHDIEARFEQFACRLVGGYR